MLFVPFEPNIEVSGQALAFLTAGFKIRPSIGYRYLQQFGLLRPGPDGKPALDVDGWYPQEAYLRCFAAIYRDVGPNTTYEIGRQLGGAYPIPPDVKDIHGAFRWLDLGYHFAHRKHGRPMFDPNTGRIVEGVGHYGYRSDGERAIASKCETPYPCELDIGIETGLATRFHPQARVSHDDAGGCRKNGAVTCTYVIRW